MQKHIFTAYDTDFFRITMILVLPLINRSIILHFLILELNLEAIVKLRCIRTGTTHAHAIIGGHGQYQWYS